MSTRLRHAAACLLLSSALVATQALAVQPAEPPHHDQILPSLHVNHDGLEVGTSLKLDAQRDFSVAARVQPFLQRHGHAWDIRWDERNDRAALVQGSGIALLPGKGNRLAAGAVALSGEMTRDLPVVASLARSFIDTVPELLSIDGLDLRLDAERSTGFGEGHTHWLLEFQQFHDNVPVDGAYVFVRIAHGNIIQFGAERIAPIGLTVDKAVASSREAAFASAWQQLGFPNGTRVNEWFESGELRIYPSLPAGQVLGMPHQGLRGVGYEHVLAWRFAFQVDDHALWQVLYDTGTGRVFDLRDLTVHADATVKGHVYPTTNIEPAIEVTFPYAAVVNNGNKVTDIDGVYNYTPGTATISLDGQYFRMADTCGAISLSNNTDGNLDLGSNSGTDCATPGFGGAGNTNASRTGFYHLTLINAKARSILPSNTWLQTKVTSNMNVNQTCNASWGGGQARFFRSGVSATNPAVTCGNTGEIAAVFLHEWGHGMDSNTGGAASENASGEAVGDTFAFLETRDSCIGPGFFTHPGGLCYNCTTCSGVRDLADFALGGARTLATPANITADDGLNCDRFACPYSSGITPYRGPMGYQGHCESHIASTANWDLKNALVAEFGEPGWQRMDQIWYGSLVPSKSAFRVASGGQCNAAASVDGCNSNNWYTVYLAIDDDNGNLADGTPNACRIWDAFNAHGIACGSRPACTEFGVADFDLITDQPDVSICAGEPAEYDIEVASLNGFSNNVTLSLTGAPAGTTTTFSSNPVAPGSNSTLTIGNTAGIASGSYPLELSGTATGSDGHDLALSLAVEAAAPLAGDLLTPADEATNQSPTTSFTWDDFAGADSYRFELADNAGFTSTLVDTVVSGTSYTAAPGVLGTSSQYFWRVTGLNGCGTGTTSAIFSFRTLAAPGDCAVDQTAVNLLSEDFSGGLGSFATTGSTGAQTWAIAASPPAGSPSAGNAVLAVNLATVSDQRLISPAVTLPSDQLPLSLQFWNHQAMESRTGGCWDGGILEVTTNAGGTWTQVTGAAILNRAYDGPIGTGWSNPLIGLNAWCGNVRPWENYIIDLNAYAGQTVQFRWRLGTDSSVGLPGWHLDDIKVQACEAKTKNDTIFADGFEGTP